MKIIRYIDLFAGIGGFRYGLEKNNKKYKCVWSNEWDKKEKEKMINIKYDTKKKEWIIKDKEFYKILQLAQEFGELLQKRKQLKYAKKT